MCWCVRQLMASGSPGARGRRAVGHVTPVDNDVSAPVDSRATAAAAVAVTSPTRDRATYSRATVGCFFITWLYNYGPSHYLPRWRGGATGRALDLRSTGRGFKSCSGQSYVTTLGKLFTPMCLCHQAV